ncbi:MAG: DUF7115 domain-containing protein [Halobacteriota archaeon]
MSLPELLATTLDGEDVRERVSLGGEDELVVTPTRTLVYRGDGLLSDESVETYGHDAEHVGVSVGRRKAKITLNYGLDGEETLALPSKRLEETLQPLLAGVLEAAETIADDESVLELFRFSDLTLVVTSARLVKHIGSAVWDLEAEEYHYDDVTDLTFEEGSVATAIVLRLGDRQERFKAPNDQARAVRESLAAAICAHHDVDSIEELRLRTAAESDPEDQSTDEQSGSLEFGDGLDPLNADPNEPDEMPANATTSFDEPELERKASATEDPSSEPVAAAESTTGGSSVVEAEPTASDAFEGSPFESAGPIDDDDVAEHLAQLTETVERQAAQIDHQAELLEQLIEELRRGR